MIPEASVEFVCQMESVLDVYERPYDRNHPVICLDETSKQLISEVRSGFTDSHGVIHEDYTYKREGVRDIYMVSEPLAGYRQVYVRKNHTSQTYARIIAELAEQRYAEAEKITLIEDNLSAHKLCSLYEIIEASPARSIIKRIEVVRTPKHGSWLNIAECELSMLLDQGLKKRTACEDQLITDATSWCSRVNAEQRGIDWQFTTEDARIKLKRLYPTIIT